SARVSDHACNCVSGLCEAASLGGVERRTSPVNEQHANVGIALLVDASETSPAAGGKLARREAEPRVYGEWADCMTFGFPTVALWLSNSGCPYQDFGHSIRASLAFAASRGAIMTNDNVLIPNDSPNVVYLRSIRSRGGSSIMA